MNAFLRKSSNVLAAILVSTTAFGQMNLSKFEFGVMGGVFIYQGDLSPSPIGSYRTPGIQMNLFATRLFGPAIGLRTNLAIGKLKGDDAAYENPEWRSQRALRFSGTLAELSELLLWYPRGNDKRLAPYVYGGVGVSFLKISRDWSRFNGEYFSGEPDLHSGLAEDIAHDPPSVIPVLPVGIGLQYGINNKFAVVAETAYRLTTSDYIDGFSKAANPGLKDHYLNHSIGIVYKPGSRSALDCPPKVQTTY